MDVTMLHQICCHGRLSEIVQDYIHSNTLFGEALEILFPDAVADTVAPIQYGDMEMAQHNSIDVTLAPKIITKF